MKDGKTTGSRAPRAESAVFFGVMTALWLTAVLAAYAMPSPTSAQTPINTLADLGQCMDVLDCLQDPDAEAETCTKDRCFTRRNTTCPGNLGICYVNPPKQELAVKIGNVGKADLADYIQAVYDFAIGAAAVLAAVMMMVGGFQYLTSGGSSEGVSAGKKRVADALIGLVLTLGAFLILKTVNPNLISLELPKIPITKRQIYAGCDALARCKPCGAQFDVKLKKDPKTGMTVAPGEGECDYAVAVGEGDLTCTGKGCGATLGNGQCNDDTAHCIAGEQGKTDQCGVVSQKEGEAPAAWICERCTPSGGDCSDTGPSNTCCGGFCGDGKCSGGDIGSECSSDAECKGGHCSDDPIWDGACTNGAIGSPCGGDNDCAAAGNKCMGIEGAGVLCTPGKEYSVCSMDKDCDSGLVCDRSTLLTVNVTGHGLCVQEGTEIETCGITGGCSDGTMCSSKGVCTDMRPGSLCAGPNDCNATIIDAEDPSKRNAHCVGLSRLKADGVCTDGTEGSPCNSDDDCYDGSNQGFCWTKGADVNICVSGRLGSRCDDKCMDGLTCSQGSQTCITGSDTTSAAPAAPEPGGGGGVK